MAIIPCVSVVYSARCAPFCSTGVQYSACPAPCFLFGSIGVFCLHLGFDGAYLEPHLAVSGCILVAVYSPRMRYVSLLQFRNLHLVPFSARMALQALRLPSLYSDRIFLASPLAYPILLHINPFPPSTSSACWSSCRPCFFLFASHLVWFFRLLSMRLCW